MPKLHIDIETYSSVDLKSAGAYKYFESLDFEILLVAYAIDNGPVQIEEGLSENFIDLLTDPGYQKIAHNANFERNAFKAVGYHVPVKEWRCSQVKAAYCGLPLSLDQLSKVLKLGDKAKLDSGKALIKYFTTPCKPTKVNGQRRRNLAHHDPEKWEEFKKYCINDVEAERAIYEKLEPYTVSRFEQTLYNLDQKINDAGIKIDQTLALNAYQLDQDFNKETLDEIKEITKLDNPNSPAQLKQWISEAEGREIKTLAKTEIPKLIETTELPDVRRVLELRQLSAKSSVKKYTAMLNSVCSDGRAHGLFQFYGANRTGRWAGRLIQLQNLPQNHIKTLDAARGFTRNKDREALDLIYGNVSDTLSQLIRTAFVAPKGRTFAVADFSAIEARVIAWLANERWRLDVFNGDGKIYEASAAVMFGVPVESVTKGSDLRQKGKIAELALGYQGAVGALKTMGGERMGLSESEMSHIVGLWREQNPKIVKLWKRYEDAAKDVILNDRVIRKVGPVQFYTDNDYLIICLPSGRELFYSNPSVREKHVKLPNGDSFKTHSIAYYGMDQTKKQWSRLDTYGGKLTENIVQAVARDLLAEAMVRLDQEGYKIVMHVHDEIVCEIPKHLSQMGLEKMVKLMEVCPRWADGLPLGADGYLTNYYKKE
jgi:DNA polymerase